MKNTLFSFRLVLALFAAAVGFSLAGCASVGQQAPRSAEDSFRYAQVSVGAAYRFLGDGQRDRTMTAAEYAKLKPQVDQANDYFKSADKLVSSGMSFSAPLVQDKVRLALAIIEPILVDLQKRYPAKTSLMTIQPTGA